MERKHIYKFIFLTLLIIQGLTFCGCDEIDEGNRLIVDDKVPQKPEVIRTVLLEDYTGVRCVNCPAASVIAHDIQEVWKEQLIIVTIHAGYYSQSTPHLQSEAGNAYLAAYHSDSKGYPAAVISRQNIDGNYGQTKPALWATHVANRLNSDFLNDREFSFSIQPNYSEEKDEFQITTTIETIDALSDIKLQLWITENNVIDVQLTPEGFEQDYKHQHVLRDAVNGIWGEDIPTIAEGSEHTMTSNTYSLQNKTWDKNNLNIVGFVYDASNREVLDVVEVKLISN